MITGPLTIGPNDEILIAPEAGAGVGDEVQYPDLHVTHEFDLLGILPTGLADTLPAHDDEALAWVGVDEGLKLGGGEIDIVPAIDHHHHRAIASGEAGDHIAVALLITEDDLAIHLGHIIAVESILEGLADALLIAIVIHLGKSGHVLGQFDAELCLALPRAAIDDGLHIALRLSKALCPRPFKLVGDKLLCQKL